MSNGFRTTSDHNHVCDISLVGFTCKLGSSRTVIAHTLGLFKLGRPKRQRNFHWSSPVSSLLLITLVISASVHKRVHHWFDGRLDDAFLRVHVQDVEPSNDVVELHAAIQMCVEFGLF